MTHRLYRILDLLDTRRLHYRIDRYRPETVMIRVTVVGERLEIDVFDDEHVEFSRFKGSEAAEDGSDIEQLLQELGGEE